jgi:enamine deaminase RidA (YjgF/YER057c/UK114 family)
MAETIAEKVLSLGWTLPLPSTPVANFLPTSRVGNLLYIAGQIPAGADRYLGRLGAELNLDLGQSAARSAALALLAHISAATGGNISSVRQVVRLGVFIAAVSDFKQHPEVANGASDLFVAVFGKAVRHVRTAIGVASLPRGVAVEVDAIVELER